MRGLIIRGQSILYHNLELYQSVNITSFWEGISQYQLQTWRDQRSLSHSISAPRVRKWGGKHDLLLILAWQDGGCGWEGANLRAKWDKLEGGGLLTWKCLAVPQRTLWGRHWAETRFCLPRYLCSSRLTMEVHKGLLGSWLTFLLLPNHTVWWVRASNSHK